MAYKEAVQRRDTIMLPGHSFEEIARKAAGLLMRYPWKVWFWGDGIGMEGLLDASALTGTRI